MATVHEIATVAHKLTTSDGELWAILWPALIASIVPGAALWFSYQQSKRTTELAARQSEATNQVALRQVDIAARQADLAKQKQVHESREDLYQAWRTFNDSAWSLRAAYIDFKPGDAANSQQRLAALRAFNDAALRMRFIFRDDVLGAVTALGDALAILRAASRKLAKPNVTSEQIDAATEEFSKAEDDVDREINRVRDNVRAYTVPGLKREV